MNGLKRVEYQGVGNVGEVAYLINGAVCVFTYAGTIGVIKKATSTINCAEEIVEAICEQEGVAQGKMTFYDIQTSLGYHKLPGQFCFDQVIFDEEKGTTWRPMLCPSEIVEAFREFIGHNAQQITNTGAPF